MLELAAKFAPYRYVETNLPWYNYAYLHDQEFIHVVYVED